MAAENRLHTCQPSAGGTVGVAAGRSIGGRGLAWRGSAPVIRFVEGAAVELRRVLRGKQEFPEDTGVPKTRSRNFGNERTKREENFAIGRQNEIFTEGVMAARRAVAKTRVEHLHLDPSFRPKGSLPQSNTLPDGGG